MVDGSTSPVWALYPVADALTAPASEAWAPEAAAWAGSIRLGMSIVDASPSATGGAGSRRSARLTVGAPAAPPTPASVVDAVPYRSAL